MRRLLLFTAAALVVAAGCIRPDDANTNPAEAAQRTANHGGAMTADEKSSDTSALCTDGGVSLPGTSQGAFCAVRTITVSGTLSGIAKMDVSLATFNGDIKVHESSGDTWGFVATLRAQGGSADEATSRIHDIAFAWLHTDGSSHFLSVEAKQNRSASNDEHLKADIDVTMPASLVMVLTGASGNGDVSVTGGQTDGLALSTGNGDVSAQSKVTQVHVSTGNGDIKASLTPTASGRVVASTGNGKTEIAVPESDAHGYHADLSTGNGAIKVGLKDGKSSPCSTDGPCYSRSFDTTGFDGRAIRTSITASTGNGDVSLAPA